MSEELGAPTGYVGVRNIAFERALGALGIPLGRMVEISGWWGAGKSTMLDQILAEVQAMGGIGALADVERARSRAYMRQLGIQDESLVWIGGRTVEQMFDEMETLARTVAHHNAIAWQLALKRAGIKCPPCNTYKYLVYDPLDAKNKEKRKPVAAFDLALWGREQSAALMEWQKRESVHRSSMRDMESREKLRPCILYGEDPADQKQGLEAWMDGGEHPLVVPADRPIILGWDSVAGTATEEELEGSARDQHPATAAKVIRRSMRRLIQLIDDNSIGVVMVNQRYEKIQMGKGRQWGPKSETYGGGGIKFHTAVRVEVEKCGDIYYPGRPKAGGFAPCGQEVLLRMPKNKLNDPFHTERFGLMFGQGAVDGWAIHEDFKSRGIIRVAGGWSSFSDPSVLGAANRSFRNWPELQQMMTEDAALSATLRDIYMEGR
tara:strand:+ start:165 stop:1466 length:1302 start_codon:yes stop_codon:yes gene_type:complete